MSLFFFFSCYDHHRDLHSFPTRRSSDLRDLNFLFDSGTAESVLHISTSLESSENKCSKGKIRSEEHTSELQSRFDLVCRLLLEKKKKKKINKKLEKRIK